MHEYLRAIGFSRIQTKEELNYLLKMTEESYQSERTSGEYGGRDFSERRKEFAPGMGIMLRGEFEIILSLLRCGALDGITGTTSYYGG